MSERIDMGSDDAVLWALQRETRELPVVVRFVVDGEPVSKARARFTNRGSKTKAYTPEKTRTAEELVGWLARAAGVRGSVDADNSFGLFAKFFCKTWQRRDVDNMLKLVSDGLTGVVWDDDSQVTEVSGAVVRGVDNPRTHILVYRTLTQVSRTKPCVRCGTPVHQYASQLNRYCSRACSTRASQRRVDVSCVGCSTPLKVKESTYWARKSGEFWCSQRCESAHKTATFVCDGCGRQATRPRSQVRGGGKSAHLRVFCDDECRATFWRNHRRESAKGVCADCGGPTSKKTYTRCMACSIAAKRRV